MHVPSSAHLRVNPCQSEVALAINFNVPEILRVCLIIFHITLMTYTGKLLIMIIKRKIVKNTFSFIFSNPE